MASSDPQLLWKFTSCGKKGDTTRFLAELPRIVFQHRHQQIPLKKPEGYKWIIGGLKDTIYKEDPGEVKEWGDFYLPDREKMVVLGTVVDIRCLDTQLVIMACSDGKVYGHDGEKLHLVASSVEELCDSGIQYPGTSRFYRGQCFKNMTDDDWAKVRKGEVGRRLEEKHQALVKSATPGIKERLAKIKAERLAKIKAERQTGASHYPLKPPPISAN